MSGPILLAAGGTGGHVFPARALAAALRRRDVQAVLATDARGVRFVDAADAMPCHTIMAQAPIGSLFKRLLAFAMIAAGSVQALLLILRLRPSAVVGFGGYPSLPVMLAALIAGRPCLIHEQNASPGRVNRFLSRHVDAVAVSFERTKGLAGEVDSIAATGNPVREEIAAIANVGYRPPEGGELSILVVGGSQGARILSQVVPAALSRLGSERQRRLLVAQQAREEDLEQVRQSYAATAVRADVRPFFDDMPARLAAAHLLISRAGAGTVAEIAAVGRPAILVPFAAARDDHQMANAEALMAAGAAFCLSEAACTPEALARQVGKLMDDPARLAAMAANARKAGHGDAADRLADLVLTVADCAEVERRAPA